MAFLICRSVFSQGLLQCGYGVRNDLDFILTTVFHQLGEPAVYKGLGGSELFAEHFVCGAAQNVQNGDQDFQGNGSGAGFQMTDMGDANANGFCKLLLGDASVNTGGS